MKNITTRDEPFDGLTANQQDHLFYALLLAREAVSDYYATYFGDEPVPVLFEQVLAHEYAKQLTETDA